MKKFEIQAINYCLYQQRNKKGISLKEASKELGINKLHLKLIERGYIHVSKKLQSRFIKFYKLNKDFFKKNTTYVAPINVKYEDPEIDKKIRENIKKKRTKLTSGIISGLLLITLGVGVYFYTRANVNPSAAWSKELTTFRNEFIKNHDGEEASTMYPGDVEYYISGQDTSIELGYKLTMPANPTHLTGLSITIRDKNNKINLQTYNKKKIGYFERESKNGLVNALFTYTVRGKYSLPKITLTQDGVETNYYPGSPEYKEFNENFLKEGAWLDQKIEAFNDVLKTRYTPYTTDNLLNDIQKASEYQVFGFRLGYRLILFPAILLALSLSVFTYALIKGRKKKTKKIKEKPYVIHKVEYTANVEEVYRSVPNDTVFPSIIPEFVLRILALAILLLASIGTVWLTQDTLTGVESLKSTVFNAYVSNFLVAGITLAFFLKLDVYHKKTHRELVDNIIALFVLGLIFYIAECITYACLSSQGTIYSALIKLLSSLLPGNIIWNLMLYSCIFLFLFTLPNKIKDQPHKVLLWRLGSVLPTLLLLAAFIYKGTFQGEVSPYISFLFHTNGILSTIFAIFYLYALFFFRQYVSLKYGREFTEVFIDSRRYALCKNMIACIVLLLLTLIDLLFLFYLPYNALNLGNNWIIATLIPFILFYRPHIGKRSPKWDLIYTAMYVLFLIGGFIISFNMIANCLDLSQLQQIIN